MGSVRIGVDPGFRQDPTGIVGIFAEGGVFEIRCAYALPLGTPGDEIGRFLARLLEMAGREGFPTVLVDVTGMGTFFSELVEPHIRGLCRLWRVTITGGGRARTDGQNLFIPRAELIGRLVALFEANRIRVPEQERELLLQLREFRERPRGRAETGHDDLVMAMAMAVWFEATPVEEFLSVSGPSRWGFTERPRLSTRLPPI